MAVRFDHCAVQHILTYLIAVSSNERQNMQLIGSTFEASSDALSRKALEVRLQSEVGPELETLQRQRSETASTPRDQRYMPINQSEA